MRASRSRGIAVLAVAAIGSHLLLRLQAQPDSIAELPLLGALIAGGLPLVLGLLNNLRRGEFGSDLLAGIAIVTSIALGQNLAGTIVVLMLSGGQVLEQYALDTASSVLGTLAKRMPSTAHRRRGTDIDDVPLDQIAIDDRVVVYPHEVCPVDGVVTEGHGSMDESYLTGEPFQMTKTTGSVVISGAQNGNSPLTIRATKREADSRFAHILQVMQESEASRPRLRRLGDQLGAWYTPLALAIALAAWAASGSPTRFLAVLVIATPCPLLISIPVAILGAISLCARRAIIIRRPAVLEQISECRTAIFDKTGTLTYGEPALTDHTLAPGFEWTEVLGLAASAERYSKHPLAKAIASAAAGLNLPIAEASEVTEPPGQGLRAMVSGRSVTIASRQQLVDRGIDTSVEADRPPGFLECAVAIDEHYAATLRFRDAPREGTGPFVRHLGPVHRFNRVMIVSGDRTSEVQFLASQLGISDVRAEQTPEDKLAIVRDETRTAKTLYVGDGVNDAPAMMAATVGIAIGDYGDVTAEASGAVIMDRSLQRVDELIHISTRMRRIALQSAIGGMLASGAGMIAAALGHLSPINGAIGQEIIDVLAIANALRAAVAPTVIHDP